MVLRLSSGLWVEEEMVARRNSGRRLRNAGFSSPSLIQERLSCGQLFLERHAAQAATQLQDQAEELQNSQQNPERKKSIRSEQLYVAVRESSVEVRREESAKDREKSIQKTRHVTATRELGIRGRGA